MLHRQALFFKHMNRIERLHAITTALQSKRIVKADELAKHFNTSVRTIYRDIRALEHGGVPIGAEAGVGYFITEGYHLPPVMFTKEEARALLMADKLMEKITDPSIGRAFGAAVTKVRAVLSTENKDELDGLEDKILVNPFPLISPEPPNQVLVQLKEALVQNRVVELSYLSNYKGETTARKVEPIGLVFYRNHWHLIGFCQLRQDYRDFRTDRMAGVRLCTERFTAYRHPSLKNYIDKLIQGTELYQVEIKVHGSLIRYLGDSKYSMGLVEERKEGEYQYMLFATTSLDYFARWLLMMLDKVEVIQPQQLKDKLLMFAGILQECFQQKEEG